MPLFSRMSAYLSILAALLFVPLLAWRRLGPLDFWWGMCLSVFVLVTLSFLTDKSHRSFLSQDWKKGLARKAGLGLLSALVLYGIFWAGNEISRAALPLAAQEIGEVYGFRQDAALLRIGLLIIFIIGPGEELFWRGFLQRRWQLRLGSLSGWLLTSAFYGAVHAGSGNVMLVLSALVCGLYWGAIYARSKSAVLVAISHTLWDLLVFIFFPLG
jgi:membrane protease YdiL (CAAX protease family)